MFIDCPRLGTFTARARRLALTLFVALFAFVLASVAVSAQTGQGSISGRVSDPAGLVVSRAAVVVTSVDTRVQYKTLTDGSGIYNVLSLNAGIYTVKVTAKGFTKALIDNVIVSTATAVQTDVHLSVGSETDTITVTAQDSLLSNASDVSTTVDNQIVVNLPYPERSALEALLLVPGVTGDSFTPGGVSPENASLYIGYVTPGASISIGGAPLGTSSILIDGSDVTQASFPRAGVNLSGQMVQEATVITSGISAQYGRTGAGVMIESSRAGTSAYHGAITYRHTDPWFNATPLGSTIPGDQHENFYGFYAGGPIFIPKLYPDRHKSFFYVGVEPARLRTTLGYRGSFPTPDELAGHFYNSLTLLNQTVLKAGGYAAALAAPRIGGLYYQSVTNAQGFPNGPALSSSAFRPITGPLADCSYAYGVSPNPGATTCADDVGPQLAQNPFAQFVMSNFPTPTNPGPHIAFDNPNATYATDGTNGSYTRGVNNTDNRYSIRIDNQFNNSNHIFVRYTVIPVRATRYMAVDPNNVLNQVPVDSALTHDIAIGYTRIITNNLVNNFHYSFMRDRQLRSSPPSTQSTDYAAKYGLTPATSGYGFPSLGGFSSNGASYTLMPASMIQLTQIDQNFIVGDDLSWTHGDHLFKFGIDVRWIQSNLYDLSGSTGGRYGFSSSNTNNGSAGGAAMATLDLGIISSFSNTPVPVPAYYRWRYYAGYFQDDWRVTPRLTLNLGLRYEVETPRMEKFNNQAYVYTNIPGSTPNGTATTNAFCFSGSCGTPRTAWPINYYGIEPRIGIAYATTPRSTIRAAYALSRLPLSGLDNQPDPDLNVAGTSVSSFGGGVNSNNITDFITNPVGPLSSVFSTLNGSHGPFFSSTGLAPQFITQNSAVPYIQTYSLSIQYQPAPNTQVQVTYQGTRGIHLIGSYGANGAAPLAFNTPPIGAVIAAVQQGQYLAGYKPNSYGITNPGSKIPLNESAEQQMEPYQNFFNQALPQTFARIGDLKYNALYVGFNQRATKNITLLANYSWSKGLDDIPDISAGTQESAGGISSPQNPFDTKSEYSISASDQPSRLTAGYNAILPLGIGQRFRTKNGIIDRIIGNISTSGIIRSQSGMPNSVYLGTSGYFTSLTPVGTPAVNGNTACGASRTIKFCTSNALPGGYTLRPNIVPGVPLINKHWRDNPFNSLAHGGITPYLNAAAFAVPGSPGNPPLGNAPRTLSNARSPREFTWDMSLVKGFTIRERYGLNLNVNFNNVFNHPLYAPVGQRTLLANTVVSNTTGVFTNNNNVQFGNLNTPGGLARVIRVGAQFTF